MNRKNLVTRLSLAATILLATPMAYAQDVHFTQFDMAPLVVNPAFTGMFDGQCRVGGIYRSQWGSVTIPYITYGAAVDAPLVTERNGEYLAGGLQLYNDKAGDGNLQNFTAMASLAYHKSFGQSELGGNDLGVGLQGGYVSKSIDLSKLYFGDESHAGSFTQGTSQEYTIGLDNKVKYYLVNAGISFSSAPSERFSYIIGVGANNINQPNDAISKRQNSETALGMRYTGQLGASLKAGERLSLRPAVFAQSQSGATEIIAGNEFNYKVANNPAYDNFSGAVFVGAWYRTGDAVLINAGFELKGFRLGLGYDYNISDLNVVSNGNGGFEIALRYIAPNSINFAKKRTVPCSRF